MPDVSGLTSVLIKSAAAAIYGVERSGEFQELDVEEQGAYRDDARAALAAALRVLADEEYSICYREKPGPRGSVGRMAYLNPLLLADEIERKS
jgi:hypothetical protein